MAAPVRGRHAEERLDHVTYQRAPCAYVTTGLSVMQPISATGALISSHHQVPRDIRLIAAAAAAAADAASAADIGINCVTTPSCCRVIKLVGRSPDCRFE